MNFILNLFTRNNSDIPKNENNNNEMIEENVIKEDECYEKIENEQVIENKNENKDENNHISVIQDINENKNVEQEIENEHSFDEIKEENINEIKENENTMNDIDLEFDFICYGIYNYKNDPKTITIYYLNCVYQEFLITKKIIAFILVNKELDLKNNKEEFEKYYKQFTNTCYFNELYYS